MPYGISYMWNLKYDTNEPIYKTETDWWLPERLRGEVGKIGKGDQKVQTSSYKINVMGCNAQHGDSS